MECRQCSLVNLVTKCMWLLTLFVGTYPHLHDHLETTDEFLSDNETALDQETPEKILLLYDDRIVIHAPQFHKCRDFIAKAQSEKTKIIRIYNCTNCGFQKFLIHRFKTREHYTLRLYASHSNESTAKFVFNTSVGFQVVSPVVSHAMMSSGPGWILFRLITREKNHDQVLTFQLTYMRFGSTVAYNMRNEWKKFEELVIQRMSYAEDPPAAAPNVKCPLWKGRNSFCILLTEFIHPESEIGDIYSDYIFRIYTYRAKPQINDPTKLELIMDSKSKAYQTTLRVWNECDTTNDGCCELNLSPEENKRQKALRVRGRPVKPSRHALDAIQQIWPLFVAIFLLALFVMAPWFYFYTKRRSKNAVLNYDNSEDKMRILEDADDGAERNATPSPVERRKARRSGRWKGREGESEPGSPSREPH